MCLYTTGELGTATDTVNYTYGDTTWGDLLTAYDGQTITYDTVGNPLTDGTWTYTWKHGRQLATMSNGTDTWTYTYNADGLRTKRTNGSTTYNYIYNGDKLSQITVGSNTLTFSYDASGTPMTVTYNDTVYYYVTNIQGDVLAIVNSNGNPLVTYTYDAWGKILTQTGSMADTLGTYNPLRYRGYIYDQETGLYYLQSRYYNPATGRFLNADAYAATGQGILGNNMFAYCNNNPVNFTDPTGLCKNTFSIYFKVDCGKDNCKTSSAYLPIEKRLEQKGVTFEPSSSGNGGRINNSYKVTDPIEQTEFAVYLKTQTDNFSGSIEGILYEWQIHNLLFEVTKEGDPWHESAKDVDLGRTIYDDNHGVFSRIMWAGFELLYPQQAIEDRIAANTE